MRCCAGCVALFSALCLQVLVDAELTLPGRRLETFEDCSLHKTIEKAFYVPSGSGSSQPNMFGWSSQPAGFSATNDGCWKFTYPMCGGKRQSPVHIMTHRRLTDAHASDDHSTDHSATTSTDHSAAADDHSTASTDHSAAADDHSTAADHSTTPVAADDHSTDHSSAADDHSTAADHSTDSMATDHSTAADHSTSTDTSSDHSTTSSGAGLSKYTSYGHIVSQPKLVVDKWFKSVRADGDFGTIVVGGKTYHAKHLQLVTSSLHKMDSKNSAGELLIVHELENKGAWEPAHSEIDTVIVSVLFETSSTSYSPLWEAMGFPRGKATLRRTWLDNTGMTGWQTNNLAGLVGSPLEGQFYGYHGSLPVPPCFENVAYYVLEQTLPVSAAQIQGLMNVLSGEGIDTTHRSAQREIDHDALNNIAITGSATDSCSFLDEESRQATAVCWVCPAGARKSPIDIDTTSAVAYSTTPLASYDLPVVKYHSTVAYAERGMVSLNVRPAQEGTHFGMLELGGRFYTADMIQYHALATHTINGVRYDGEIHIHHYLYGDEFANDTKGRRMDVFRGDTHSDENVHGAPSFQVISVIPLQVTSNPGGDFMDSIEPHGAQTGEKAYISHDDLKPIFAGDFYQYRGSLIWPACSENVAHWLVYETPLKVSAEQLFTEYPTRSGFDTTPNMASAKATINKNHVPEAALGDGKPCKATDTHWTYADTHCWSGHYPNCAKSAQSPINIITENVVSEATHLKDNFMNFVKYHPVANMVVKHTGHALQIADKMNGVSHLGIGYVEIDGQFYFLRQLHLHCPSEHVTDGHQHACEVHLVHQRQDHWGSTGFSNNDILVVGIFFDIGPEESTFLKQMYLPGLETEQHVNSSWTRTLQHPVDLQRALGPVLKGDYYRYAGSFTTPPCDEVVKWFVFKTSLSISKEQYASFKSAFPNPANARPVQPMNSRLVNLNSFQAPGEQEDTTDYEFWLDRYHGRDRENPGAIVVLGGIIGGVLLTVLIMCATFIRQNKVALTQSAGGLVASEPVGRSASASRYRPMNDRM